MLRLQIARLLAPFAFFALVGATVRHSGAQTPARPADLPVSTLPLDPAMQVSTIPLWDGPAPHSHGSAPEDIPTLTLFRPIHPNGTAVIIAPGGAYVHLSANLEGRQPADRLATLGVTVFVLKYRLSPAYTYPVPLEDARRAVRLVRSLAPRLGYAPDRIGMMGFSAGGHLTATAGVLPEPGKPGDPDAVEHESSELNFLMLVYPWLNAMQPQVQGPSGPMINYCSVVKGLTQADCQKLAQEYTPFQHVKATTPPTFIFHTTQDRTVPVSTSLEFYSAMQAAGDDVELHVFARGGHGSGLGGNDPALSEWPHLLEIWLRARGLLTPPTSTAPTH